MNTEEFIQKAKVVHKDKYDYSKVEYIHSKKQVIIICSEHGEFKQVAANHLHGNGCPKCGKKKYTTASFIEEAKKIHNLEYNYDKVIYRSLKQKIIITCKTHGDWATQAIVHLNGAKCPKCNYGDLNTFIEKSNIIHNNKYDYKESKFITQRDKVIIICPIHGKFLQAPRAHLSGQGCKICSNELNLHKKADWMKKYKNKTVIFYILKCWNEEEKFYKIGISGNFKQRYDSNSKMPYKYKLVYLIQSKNTGYIFDLEKFCLNELSNFKYKPTIKFKGSRECFNINANIQNIVTLYSDI